jgi:Lambda phage tail tube protein, TTP
MAISGHGTLVQKATAALPLTFVTIAELGAVTPPPLSRNEFDATTQNLNIDTYVLGVLRRGQMTVPMNFIPTDPTQNHIAGLYKSLITEPPPVEGYRIQYPDVGATVWVMSGQVQGIAPTAPVDGLLSANVTIRFSGKMIISNSGGSITIG